MRSKTQIPKGWRQVRLGDVASINRGVSWSKEQESRALIPDTVPVVRISNVRPGGFRMNDTLYIKDVPSTDKARNSITTRTLVMVGSNGNRDRVGNTYLATPQVIGHLLASFLIGIEPCGDTSERFLSAILRSTRMQSMITDATAGSTGLKNLSLNWLRDLRLGLPPLPEQRAIAAVLDSIDDAIKHTEAVIAATEQLRDSLLYDLLTRGVPGWHTEWKDVPGLGTIPAEWEVVRLGDVIEDGPTNGIYKPESEYGSGVWLIRIDDFVTGALVKTEGFQRIRATEEEVLRYGLRQEDILINRVNSLSHIGKSVMIPRLDEPILFESNMMKFRMHVRVHPTFAVNVLLSKGTRQYFISRAKKAVQQASINQQDVCEMPFPLPPLPEQQAIAELLDGMNATLERARTERIMLQSLKEATAETLLTGWVRVGGI